jgi:hypothetical protein
MYDGFIRAQPCQSQSANFGSYTHLLAALAIVGELHIVFQCQSLRDEVVVDEVEDSSRKQIGRYIQVPRIASSQLKSIYCEAVARYVGVCGREDGRLGLRKRRRLSVIVRVV